MPVNLLKRAVQVEGAIVPTDLLEPGTSCSSCRIRQMCLPVGVSAEERRRLDQLVYARRKVKRGEDLYRVGNPFSSIYAIRGGCFKSDRVIADGRAQIMGFHMSGEIIGMDGIGEGRYTCNAVALADSEVCVIPLVRLEEVSREVPLLQHQFHQIMSREMVRDQGLMLLLANSRAEVRLATFLIEICARLGTEGTSDASFELPMTREEIGSFLGLTLETVSRHFSKLQALGLIAVLQRHIRILDLAGLEGVLHPVDQARRRDLRETPLGKLRPVRERRALAVAQPVPQLVQ